ncbi:hypothetical protein CAPTEDRAFT_223916, partial [Capitella teleta]
MSGLFGSARQLCRSLLMSRPARPAVLPPVVSNQHRFTSSNSDDSSYNAYQEYETPSPFVPIKHGRKFGYTMKYYKGGPLPRDEKHKDMPYGYFPKFDAKKRDQWVKTKAQFGQNDYIATTTGATRTTGQGNERESNQGCLIYRNGNKKSFISP